MEEEAGQAGGGTSSAVERVDGAGAPMGGTSGIDLASETKTSVVSPQRANPKQTDDASTLAKGLLGVTLVPETTVQSAPDATSSPPVDQEVPTDSHLVPFGFSLDPPSDFASVEAFIEACPNPPGYGMRSPWDRLTAVSTYGPLGSEEDDEPDFSWDFSGLGNPSAMRDFMTACNYCLSDCSDGSRSLGDEDCCWGLVLKCYELRTRQHEVLNINVLRPRNIIPLRIMDLGRRLMTIRLRRLNLRNCSLIDCIKYHKV